MNIRKVLPISLGALALVCTGCSRSTINYQIAEAIGTVGMYANNEPVETPRMREVREQEEQQVKAEEQLQKQLEKAMYLANGCFYDEALELLNAIELNENTTEEVQNAIAEVTAKKASLKTWTDKVPHLCFPTLIENQDMAFDQDARSASYNGTMVTTSEFKAILQALYENGYMLVDLHNVAALDVDSRGIATMEMEALQLPDGKKPIILSQDNVNYAEVTNGDGIATRLALDGDRKVKAVYTDDGGHDLVGDYDFIPILDTFIEEHPDFAYQGARGIVSVSGAEGVFGYTVRATATSDNKDNQETVRAIAEALTSEGWSIACAGYNHGYMNELSTAALEEEIERWQEEVGTLVGKPDILFYPYGAEVKYPSEQLDYLTDQGLVYLSGLWGDTDFTEQGELYLRQTRRFVDGYTLQNAASYFTKFFDAREVLDR